MSGAGRVESRGKTIGRVSETTEEEYKPSHRPERCERSPYLTRAAEVAHKEHRPAEEEVDRVEEEEVEQMEGETEVVEVVHKKKHSKRAEGAESRDMVALFQMMLEREAEEKEYRRQRDAAEAMERLGRKEAELEIRKEADQARRRELADMFQQFHEMDGERRRREREAERGEEAVRRREDNDVRREFRKEDDIARERRELLGEKLKSLGNYKEGNELGGYLEKFERILGESGVKDKDWVERLYPRLPERLCSRVAEARDSRARWGN